MDKKYAEYLLNKTREDYNLIAEGYTRTRAFIPEDIKMMADYAVAGERVLDSGCASGRFFGVLKPKNIEYFGIDISEKLIEIAKKTYPEGGFQVINALNLSFFPDNYFDKVFSVSVLHNVPSKEFRAEYLKEIYRVLKSEGLLVLRVWDFWKRKEGWKLFLKYTFLRLIGKSKLDFLDVFVPWKYSKDLVIKRYFHCFTKGELKNLIKKSGFKVEKCWRAGKDPRTNIYIIAKK